MSGIKVLNSKLLIPQCLKAVQRHRMNSITESIAQKKLTLVTAAAGYGKTAMAAQTVRKSGLMTVWYSLDSSDIDFTAFISGLGRAIQKHCPQIEALLKNFASTRPISEQSRRNFLVDFLNMLESRIKDAMIIVLDDYHLVHDSPEIGEAMQFILEYLPLSIHIVIISHIEPNLRISRLRAMREVHEINEYHLKFTLAEIEALFSVTFGIAVSSANIENLYAKTGGWAAGLILFHYALKDLKDDGIEKSIRRFNGSHRFIFQYFEENVFDSQSSETQKFMLKTSILDNPDIEFCNKFLEIENAGELLENLVEKHLFTFPADEQRLTFYYHPLLNDFLQAVLIRRFNKKEVRDLHLEAARLLMQSVAESEAPGQYSEEALFKETAESKVKNHRIAGNASAVLKNISDYPPDLNIRLFGKFRVFKGNEEIHANRWKSLKALMIFKYLAFRCRQGFIPKEYLMEMLWPEEDARKTNKRLNVALSALRKILEPQLERSDPSSYIMRIKG